MNICACLGPQDGQPACPCMMKSGFSQPFFTADDLHLLRQKIGEQKEMPPLVAKEVSERLWELYSR